MSQEWSLSLLDQWLASPRKLRCHSDSAKTTFSTQSFMNVSSLESSPLPSQLVGLCVKNFFAEFWLLGRIQKGEAEKRMCPHFFRLLEQDIDYQVACKLWKLISHSYEGCQEHDQGMSSLCLAQAHFLIHRYLSYVLMCLRPLLLGDKSYPIGLHS